MFKKKINSLISILLSFVLVFTSSSFVFADESVSSRKNVTMDGVEYVVDIEMDKTTITAKGYDMKFVFDYESGKAIFEGKDAIIENGDMHDSRRWMNQSSSYEINITDLNEDNINVTVCENGEVVKVIDDYQDLYDYEGQITIYLGGIAIGYVISVLVGALAIVVIGTVTYIVLEQLVQDISKDDNLKNKGFFYAQLIYGGIAVNPKSIDRATASNALRGGSNIYTYTSANALAAVSGTGQLYYGPEIDNKRYIGTFYYFHYHVANSNGPHAWYGTPVAGTE